MANVQHEEKIKVCFILPETAADTATHFSHKRELMDELEDRVEFFVCEPTLVGMLKMKFAYFFRGFKIFYVHYSFKGALVAVLLTKLFGGIVYYWNCGMPWLYKRGWLEERLFHFILRNAIFVTGTENMAGEYVMRYGINIARVRVIPNYIRVENMRHVSQEDARKEFSIPADKKVVLFLHHFSRRKGAHLLPDIIKEFSTSDEEYQDDVLFLIVGDGPSRTVIDLQIKANNLQRIVRMEGTIPNNRVPSYFAAADIYLMPSEEEGMPNALLEAMAAGVPFVASDVAAVREMIPPITQEFVFPYGDIRTFGEKINPVRNGVFLESSDESSTNDTHNRDFVYKISNGIKKLLADEELREKISFEEQEWVKRYDVSIIALQFLELFQEVKKIL